MNIKELFYNIDDINIFGSKEIEIKGICSHSKEVKPGDLFIAKKGLVTDGAKYVKEAVELGAQAVLTDTFHSSFTQITQIVYPNIQNIEGAIASSFFRHPSSHLFMVGITGTNGKTSTAYLTHFLWEYFAQGSCGLMGTIEYFS